MMQKQKVPNDDWPDELVYEFENDVKAEGTKLEKIYWSCQEV